MRKPKALIENVLDIKVTSKLGVFNVMVDGGKGSIIVHDNGELDIHFSSSHTRVHLKLTPTEDLGPFIKPINSGDEVLFYDVRELFKPNDEPCKAMVVLDKCYFSMHIIEETVVEKDEIIVLEKDVNFVRFCGQYDYSGRLSQIKRELINGASKGLNTTAETRYTTFICRNNQYEEGESWGIWMEVRDFEMQPENNSFDGVQKWILNYAREHEGTIIKVYDFYTVCFMDGEFMFDINTDIKIAVKYAAERQ